MTEHQNDLPLTPGCIVLIAAFDDVPEHSFRVEEVLRTVSVGWPSRVLSQGNTESQTSRSSCGCSRARNRTTTTPSVRSSGVCLVPEGP